jgi:class 3 adenylate cyclase/tetratricopeptide (TPR) repeat protein
MEGERKLVTVLFADVANYTAMSETLDPEKVHQIMDGCFSVLMDNIHKHEGTINQFTGDGVMALFGAPVAHEDHAQRACHAALAIQEAISGYGEKMKKDIGIDFSMRIGLNSGPVVVGSIGDDLRMDYTAVGDTTNLASRMQNMAEPGIILISESTHRLIRDYFEFKSLGKVMVKGKEKPQESFELIKTAEITTRLEAAVTKGLTRYVGRRNSMNSLMEAYTRMEDGSGQVIGIVGEAGVGKSRFLFEFRNRILQDQFTYYEGRCLHYGGTMPYIPILDILRSAFNIKKDDREYIIKEKIEAKIAQLRMDLAETIPPIQDLLSLKVNDENYINLEPNQKKNRTFETIRNLLIRESHNNLLIVAIEDLHWIDKISEELLDYLIGWLTNARILMILLYRPEFTHQWGSKSYYNRIGLGHLTVKSSAELVEAILTGSEVVPEIKELILNRATGNPLYMEEVTQTLIENGSIRKKDAQYILSQKPSEVQVPDTIQGIIAARMDRLDENLKRIMQVASVIGREFAFPVLQAITGIEEDLKSHLLNLQRLELIYEKTLFPELEYIFKHALTQEVAYNSLLQQRRKEIHEQIGRAIETLYPDRLEEHYELLAHHYGRSGNIDKTIYYLELSNQKAQKIVALVEAKAYFEEALAHLKSLPKTEENRERLVSLLVRQDILFEQLFEFKDYHDLLTGFESMVVRLGNPKLMGAYFLRMGGCEHHLGSTDQAIHNLTKAAKLCESNGNAEHAGEAYTFLVWAHTVKGEYIQALAFKDDALRMIGQWFNPRNLVRGLCAATWAYAGLGRWDEAIGDGEKAMKVAEEYSLNDFICLAAAFLSLTYTHKGDYDKALENGELAVQKAPTPFVKALGQRALGLALCRAGDTSKGIEFLEAALSIHHNSLRYSTSTKCCLGEGYWLAGEDGKARQILEDILEILEPSESRRGVAYRLLGEIALNDNPTKAAHHFEKSITLFKEINAENELALAYAGYGRLHRKQGQIKQAREYLSKAIEIFERLGTLIEPDKVREDLATLKPT